MNPPSFLPTNMPAETSMETPGRYDLFISYAHTDDTGGTITALVDEIKARQQRIDGQPMRIFFDREGIRDMDDWEMRILTALRQSRVMIAMLSPAYFESEYCRKEWAWFVDRETERALARWNGGAIIRLSKCRPFNKQGESPVRHLMFACEDAQSFLKSR